MHIRDLNGKRVCILGFGKEGRAMLEAIERYAPEASVTILDQNPSLTHPDYPVIAGPMYLDRLDQFDILIKSPGIPPSDKLRAASCEQTSPTQIFLDTIADSGAITVGVTGSKGKSTTASLIHGILTARSSLRLRSGQAPLKAQSYLIGNIGDPAIAHIGEAKPGTVFVMEMSSYQLMDLTTSPHIAVVTSFFPEHLDYHGSLEAYLEAKKHIARHQGEDDVVFFAADDPGAAEIAKEGNGRKIPFSPEDAPVRLEETHLIGRHNLSNIAAACMVAEFLDVPRKSIIRAVRSFRGLPHRLQSLGIHHDIEWVDDAISTTPDSTIAALDALGDRVQTIILGGQDRGVDFTHLGQRIAASSIRTVILFPGSGPRIREVIESAHASAQCFDARSMEEAVNIALKNSHVSRLTSHVSPIVLLSTASPSYGMFKNFEEKGDQFKSCIE